MFKNYKIRIKLNSFEQNFNASQLRKILQKAEIL